MNLNVKEWRHFRFGDYIDEIYKAQAHSKVNLDISDKPLASYVPFITRTEANNSVDCYVPQDSVVIEKGNAITIGDTTATISYQEKPFSTGDHIVVIRAEWINVYTANFIIALLNRERFRYSYGRAFLKSSIQDTVLLLPATNTNSPDWEWMERYIKTLKYKPITTKNNVHNTPAKGYHHPLDTSGWQPFLLHRIFRAHIGTNIDAVATSKEEPMVNYVTRGLGENGVSDKVDLIEEIVPLKAGFITLALGGSLGACYVQNEDFYTGQNVAILEPREELSTETKLFLTSIIRFETRIKFQPFGRELNSHYKKDFYIKLPIKRIGDAEPVIDATKKYSDDGYVPDWDWMEAYVKTLPYSDRITTAK